MESISSRLERDEFKSVLIARPARALYGTCTIDGSQKYIENWQITNAGGTRVCFDNSFARYAILLRRCCGEREKKSAGTRRDLTENSPSSNCSLQSSYLKTSLKSFRLPGKKKHDEFLRCTPVVIGFSHFTFVEPPNKTSI